MHTSTRGHARRESCVKAVAWTGWRSDAGRWEFVGIKAPERIRKKYVGRYVGDQFRQGGRNPVRYVNV
jgi:hypothetical protein